MTTEPERTPQTAPADLEALREAEAAARWLISKPTSDDVERLDRYVSAVEARVRAEEQAKYLDKLEAMLQESHPSWGAIPGRIRAEYEELFSEAARIYVAVRDQRDAARAEVGRLRTAIEREVEGQHQQSCEAYWVGKAECYCHVGRLLAALSTEESE